MKMKEKWGTLIKRENTEDDEETGLWSYKGLSEHKPKKMVDKK